MTSMVTVTPTNDRIVELFIYLDSQEGMLGHDISETDDAFLNELLTGSDYFQFLSSNLDMFDGKKNPSRVTNCLTCFDNA